MKLPSLKNRVYLILVFEKRGILQTLLKLIEKRLKKNRLNIVLLSGIILFQKFFLDWCLQSCQHCKNFTPTKRNTKKKRSIPQKVVGLYSIFLFLNGQAENRKLFSVV